MKVSNADLHVRVKDTEFINVFLPARYKEMSVITWIKVALDNVNMVKVRVNSNSLYQIIPSHPFSVKSFRHLSGSLDVHLTAQSPLQHMQF